MKAVIEIRIEAESGPYVQEVACVERDGHRLADIGLSLAESKSLLTAVQKIVVEHQTAEYLEEQRKCPHCGDARARKGSHTVNLQTLFGNLAIDSPRWGHCPRGVLGPDDEHQFIFTIHSLSPKISGQWSVTSYPKFLQTRCEFAATGHRSEEHTSE